MQTITLSHSDLTITRMTFGAWAIVGGFNWGHQEEKDSLAALREAYEQGITFFDTAQAYGNGASERMIHQALGDVYDKIVIATKIVPDDFGYEDVKQACEARIQALQSDHLDLLQLHWPNPAIPVEETMRALVDLKQEGKIRAFGVSNFGKQDLTEALEVTKEISSNQLPYNLLWRAIEFDILPLCNKHQIPVLSYSSIMQGLLAGKFSNPQEVPDDRARSRHFSSERSQTRHSEGGQETLTFKTIAQVKQIAEREDIPMARLSMAWLLAQSGMGSIIVGARNPQQVRDNVATMQVSLSDKLVEELNEITRSLKEALGSNADMWQSDSRIH
ncbi:aldo/keto reductase [Tunicatimonas pelagia]|uniref:aldo/keto reductase n=1 Tax=Tunicatimonas pelagia TaxID=931531 RepID=UPI0026660357|nr:aldo/keto reductase [Tunicatimonas pelagia]WKN42923.1 aldo/keto reductase [Tunicatimonas pelagia]